jgi:hypothetical protein
LAFLDGQEAVLTKVSYLGYCGRESSQFPRVKDDDVWPADAASLLPGGAGVFDGALLLSLHTAGAGSDTNVARSCFARIPEKAARLAFEHGHRFYSYKGLHSFKAKYGPQ